MRLKRFRKGEKDMRSEMLPSRSALTSLTSGDPVDRSLGNYAKRTPSGLRPPKIRKLPIRFYNQ